MRRAASLSATVTRPLSHDTPQPTLTKWSPARKQVRTAPHLPTSQGTPRPAPARLPLVLVAFGALLAGLGEFALRILVLRWSPYLDQTFQLNPQAIWMGPLAALPLVTVAVSVAWVISFRSRHDARRFGIPLGAVLFVAAFQLGMTTSRVHVLALVLLALGSAVQLSRWACTRQAATAALIRRSTLVLMMVSLGGGLGWNAWKRLRESRAYGALPALSSAPNVLLLILDTVGARELSLYGYDRPTSPFLASFAAEGIRFDRALATAPWTLPSHASFFTGRYPHELNVGWTNALDDRYPTLAEEFARSGFATAGFAANSYFGTWRHGLDRGFQHYSDFAVSFREILANSNLNRRAGRFWRKATGRWFQLRYRSAENMNDDLLHWIDRRPAGRPFFAFVNYIDAHSPYLPPAPYPSLYSGSPNRKWLVNKDVAEEPPSPERISSQRNAYDGAITYLDAQLSVLFQELDKRGLTTNTIVLIAADHGESLGEHGFLEHGVSLYLSELHVPLLIRLPGKAHAGCVVREWVTLRDIPATLGAATRLPSMSLPGNSLIDHCAVPGAVAASPSPLLAETVGRTHLPHWYPASEGDLSSIIVNNLHYLRYGTKIERLYDTSVDFAEKNDLSGDPAYADALALTRAALNKARN